MTKGYSPREGSRFSTIPRGKCRSPNSTTLRRKSRRTGAVLAPRVFFTALPTVHSREHAPKAHEPTLAPKLNLLDFANKNTKTAKLAEHQQGAI